MRLLKWLVGLTLVVVVLLGVAPLACKWYLLYQLEEKGFDVKIKRFATDFIFGEITLSGVSLTAQSGAQISLFDAVIKLDWSTIFSGPLELRRVEIDQLRLDLDRGNQGLTWAGIAPSELARIWGGDRPLHIGSVQLNNTELCRLAIGQCLRIESTSISRMRLSDDASWQLVHEGPLAIEKVYLQSATGDSALLYVGNFQVDQGTWTPQSWQLQKMAVENFQFVESVAGGDGADAFWQTQLGQLQMDSLRLRVDDAASLAIGDTQAISLRQALRNADRLTQASLLDSMEFWAPPIRRMIARLTEGGSEAVPISVGEFDLRDGAFSFADNNVTPSVSETLTQIHFYLQSADNQTPAQQSEMRLSAKIGNEGLFKAEGKLAPFAPRHAFSLNGLLQDFELAHFTGYSERWFGQTVLGGILDVGFDLQAEQGNVSGETLWRLTNVQLTPSATRQSMPLEAAIKLLEDRNQSVPVELILQGRSDEVLDLRGVLNQLADTLRRQAQQHVKGTGVLRGEQTRGESVHFRPLTYTANSRRPLESELTRLDEIVGLLKGKPQLSVTLCPISTGGEWAEIYNEGRLPSSEEAVTEVERDDLLSLGRARGKTLRELLLDKGLEDQQVSVCEADLDVRSPGLSHVTISL